MTVTGGSLLELVCAVALLHVGYWLACCADPGDMQEMFQLAQRAWDKIKNGRGAGASAP